MSEGDAVLFLYREDLSSIKRTNIVSFKWDYDNDGAWDFSGTTNSLNQTWYATYKSTGTQTVQGVFMPWPKLQVTYRPSGDTNLSTTNIVGMTENLYGDTNIERRLLISRRTTANQDLRVDLSASTRLLAANPTNLVRFTVEVNWLKPSEVVSEEWFFDVPPNGPPSTNIVSPGELASVGWSFPEAGEYAVALRVNYVTNGSDTLLSLTKSNAAFIKVLPSNAATEELSLGRAYARSGAVWSAPAERQRRRRFASRRSRLAPLAPPPLRGQPKRCCASLAPALQELCFPLLTRPAPCPRSGVSAAPPFSKSQVCGGLPTRRYADS